MEISAVGVTKGGALAALCDRLGVTADEVVAFGDMPNDLPMLTWAGTSYAVANAHESVRAAADHVAPRNTEDGVAAILAAFTACDVMVAMTGSLRRALARRVSAAALVGAVLLAAAPASPASAAPAPARCPASDLDKQIKQADVVFRGVVEKVAAGQGQGHRSAPAPTR